MFLGNPVAIDDQHQGHDDRLSERVREPNSRSLSV